jgi:hypothetical protein
MSLEDKDPRSTCCMDGWPIMRHKSRLRENVSTRDGVQGRSWKPCVGFAWWDVAGDDIRRLLRYEAELFAEANQFGLAAKSAGSTAHAKCNQLIEQSIPIGQGE